MSAHFHTSLMQGRHQSRIVTIKGPDFTEIVEYIWVKHGAEVGVKIAVATGRKYEQESSREFEIVLPDGNEVPAAFYGYKTAANGRRTETIFAVLDWPARALSLLGGPISLWLADAAQTLDFALSSAGSLV